MKKLLAGLLVAALGSMGCNQDSTRGGPGAATGTGSNTNTVTANKPVIGEPEGTFELSVPLMATRIKQGETKAATISLSRGKNFEEDVTLKFEGLPTGVTADGAPVTRDQKEAKVEFHAATDAAVGEFNVTVVGHPSKGADSTNKIKIDVVAK